ncbi:LacI family DNA-binding transcriptional regulator [Aureimonas glaciei]|uniref:LacI family transcriptional regulator n=1 Tax=Aureimonas glaciei TaxID=1776957 RepID=A0A917DJ35_9HYPH|nr:LacI family DNA-binding transcriptional regulator [Aureimonas glaciei]GGD42679.1 LacI family transcriptional regulator [Aureimonas glaciei]
MTRKTSLADVASAAGVSVATVSRALNNPGMVTPELRERISKATRELGYVPNGAARALASKRTRTIGVVVPTLGISVFARGVEAMQDRLGIDGYRLVVANSRYDARREFEEVQSLLSHGIDGLILVGNERSPDTRRLIRRYECPVVVTFVHEASEDYPAVGFDNFASAYDLTRYLLAQGHRNVAVLSSPTGGNDRIRSRRDGILAKLTEADAHLSCLLEVPYAMSAGRDGLKKIMDAAPETTCLVCTTDVLAVGAMSQARDLGIDVPGQLSIAGYDGLDFASYLAPGLTTVTVPAAEIGNAAAERMTALLSGRMGQASTVLEAALTIRGSTGSPRTP